MVLYRGRVGVDKGVCLLLPDHHSEEEEKVVHEEDLSYEEAYQEEKAFCVPESDDLEGEDVALTLYHKEVVTFGPLEEEVAGQTGAVIGAPWGEGVAHGSPWVYGLDPPLGESSCHLGRAFFCLLG